MSILVVGSVGLDSVQTPFGRVKEVLGGTATYFSIAASLYAPVNLVAVVGTDFPGEHIDLLKEREVDLKGLQVAKGKTFRWSARYDYDLGAAETLDTQLNVFASFRPQLPEEYRASKYVFLANIDPHLQLEVLEQVEEPRLTVLDTMNYWINYKKKALTEAMGAVDIVMINEDEARQYANTFSLIRATREILGLGPRAVVVKKGEYGAAMFCAHEDPCDAFFFAPAYPLEKISDPTGAGDSFAGGFMGCVAQQGDCSDECIKQAIVHGSVVASFAVEEFGTDRLRHLTREEIEGRYQEFKHFTHFEPLEV